MTDVIQVRVYARDGCHLCDEALSEIRALDLADTELDIEVLDIDTDDLLLAQFLERIPVVEVDGDLVSELVFDRASFIGALKMVGDERAGYPD